MEAQGRIAQQLRMDEPGEVVGLEPIESVCVIVLRQTRAIAERFTDSHIMEKPMRPPGINAGKTIRGGRQHRAHEIVRFVPVSNPTAQQHDERGLDVHAREIRSRAPIHPARHEGPTQKPHQPRAGAGGGVSPLIALRAQRGKEPILVYGLRRSRAKQRRVVSPGIGGKGLTAPIAGPVENQAARRKLIVLLPIIVIFV